MKTASIRDLRNDFRRISKWLEVGESVRIVRRGKPFARLVPEPSARSFFGRGAGTVDLPDDIDDPVGMEWKATR